MEKDQEGGRMIDSGGYGCIFDPPLLCETPAQNRRASRGLRGHRIGKISEPEDTRAEQKAAVALRNVPNAKDYFVLIYPNSICSMAPPTKQKEGQGIQTCGVFQKKGYRGLLHYQMPWGGITIRSVFQASREKQQAPFQLHAVVERLLEIGATLVLHSIVHYDIHMGNILFDEKTLLPKMIDFGFAFHADDINRGFFDTRWKEYDAAHPVEPPEITIFTGIRKGLSTKRAFTEVAQQKRPLRDAELLVGQQRTDQAREFLAFWNSSKAAREGNYVDLFKTYWSKFDAWGVGGVLLHIYQMSSGLPAIQAQAGYAATARRLKDLIRGLVRMNPRDRMDCVEALVLWNPDNTIVTSAKGEEWLQQRDRQRKAMATALGN